MDHIIADAAGLFTPQKKGPAKLTIIIEDEMAQGFALSKLCYGKVKVSPVDEGTEADLPMFVMTEDQLIDKIAELSFELQSRRTPVVEMVTAAGADEITPPMFDAEEKEED